MNIVGISALFHDSACCLLKDGKLVAAAEEERFSRIKHDASMPAHAFRYCLREAGLTIADIDCIAYYEDPKKKLGRQIWMGLPEIPARNPEAKFRLDASRAEREIRAILGYEGPIEKTEHHLAHAASSYYYSGFRDSAILTVDGVGEWATTSYGFGKDDDLKLFEEVQFPDSLGILYSTITSYLGFSVNDAEYKVMGLAPYGKPVHVDQIRQLIQVLDRGQFRLNLEFFDFLNGEKMYSPRLVELFQKPVRTPESEILQFHKDISKSLQTVLEEILLEKTRYLKSQVDSENLCMAGGVALNCVANGRIKREGPFRRLFVQPAASDAGSALGAAAIAYQRLTGRRPSSERLAHVYLGPAYSDAEIGEFLSATSVAAEDYRDREKDLISATAERLAKGKVIGWFQGRMEFGPRSLGARSILADPRGAEMRDRINALVKKREAFRPFAPAVLSDKAGEHFDLDHESPFMLETCQVKSRFSLPAITHVDGSARVQTVERSASPRFEALLREFDRQTGCPILLNTSFNLRGEAIVLDPFDAIWCFVRSQIDCLVLGNFIIDREQIPPLWLEMGDAWEARRSLQRSRRAGPGAVSHMVYTFF